MSFPIIDEQLRTDANFRLPDEADEAQIRHHSGYSIMQELPIDMVVTFPTSDPLHLLELGIMKRCVQL